jgi:multidrug efflux pump
MSLYSLSIRRPVLAIVMSLTILLFGGLGFSRLGIREFPSVDPPIITVVTNYRGASADVIETQITEPLEDSINGIDGIRTLTSVSREGRSTIQVEFDLGSDLERAANDVRDRVSRAQRNLPPDVDPPSISKADADARPVVALAIGSDARNLMELTRFADDVFVERLQTIQGVSRIDIWGRKIYCDGRARRRPGRERGASGRPHRRSGRGAHRADDEPAVYPRGVREPHPQGRCRGGREIA